MLNRNYIGNHIEIAGARAAIDELNELPPAEGFIFRHYCRGGGTDRQYFSDDNGRRIDAIRTAIERWRGEEDVYFFLLASLIESADKVANTASVYGAYLKNLKPSAAKKLTLQPATFETNGHEHDVFNTSCAELIGRVEGDILYLDPPYNERQYGANYHLLNTIALYDDFVPRGKTGMREYRRSNWCCAARVADELAQTEYTRFRADKEQNRNHKANTTQEFLHILEK